MPVKQQATLGPRKVTKASKKKASATVKTPRTVNSAPPTGNTGKTPTQQSINPPAKGLSKNKSLKASTAIRTPPSVKQTSAKKGPPINLTTQLSVVPIIKTGSTTQTSSIWTEEVSQNFYGSVNALFKALSQGAKTPKVPENYRNSKHQDRRNSGSYVLSYNEELHFADHFAFLAQVEAGPDFVSAVTIEESHDPPRFTVRLASNTTPKQRVKEGLEKIIQVVRDYARDGRDRDAYKMKLFRQVVILSQKRIYERLQGSGIKIRCHKQEGGLPSLSSNIRMRLFKLGDKSLDSALNELLQSIHAVEMSTGVDRTELLEDVIFKSFAVSRHEQSKSLADSLRAIGCDKGIWDRREVLEIDKLSKYLELCDDLIRLGRLPSTREQCLEMKLEVLTSYPAARHLASPSRCHTHCEVQLILFYEQHPKDFPPRAIGSSKSACFLCDLFIRTYGGFGISHSHMKLYPKWTIPEATWMNSHQISKFQAILQDMALSMKALLREGISRHDTIIESRAHLPQFLQPSDISSVAVPLVPEPRDGIHDTLELSETHSITLPRDLASIRAMTSTYYLEDLPIILDIVPSTISCTLLIGKVDYIFDVEEIGYGQMSIDECTEAEKVPSDLRFDIRQLTSEEERICSGSASHSIRFHVHDEGDYELTVSVTWDP